MKKRNGFTLLEILIAVIIIAVLAAVAVSAYQRAVVKSRFSSLMPTTRAIRDGQEAYYMRNGTYATAIADLDVKASNGSGMEIVPGSSTDTDFKYVFATRPNLNNNLLAYQQHSPKFSGHIHCEALKDNSLAEWLCADALHGTKISGSVSGEDYETYVLEGEIGDNDYFAQACRPASGATKQCSCGGPLSGTCNDKTGTWSYSGECPTPTLESPKSCGNGYSGTQVQKAKCNNAGTAYEYSWDRTGCTATTWYGHAFDYGNTVKDAQEIYYAEHGQYATSLAQLGLGNLPCPEGVRECKFASDHVETCYSVSVVGQPNRIEQGYCIGTNYDNAANNYKGQVTCWGSSWSGYGGVPGQRCQEAGGVRIGNTDSYLISG